MDRSRTTAQDRLSGLRGSVTRQRRTLATPDDARATESRAQAAPSGAVSVPFSTGRALVISQDAADRLLLEERLSTSGEFEVEIAPDIDTAIDLARTRHFDVIALDVPCTRTPAAGSFSQLLETAHDTAIVVIGGSDEATSELAAIDAGAQEYVPREQLGGDSLLRAVRRAVGRHGRRVELDRLANVDPLTGLLNRRGFDELGARALDAAERLGTTFTVMLLDIDGLEQINRGFGHSAGDDALRETACAIVECVRTTDIVARIDGDVFCIALTDGSAPPETVAHHLGLKFDRRNERREGWLLSLTLGASHADECSVPALWSLVDEAASRMQAARATGDSAQTPRDGGAVGPSAYA